MPPSQKPPGKVPGHSPVPPPFQGPSTTPDSRKQSGRWGVFDVRCAAGIVRGKLIFSNHTETRPPRFYFGAVLACPSRPAGRFLRMVDPAQQNERPPLLEPRFPPDLGRAGSAKPRNPTREMPSDGFFSPRWWPRPGRKPQPRGVVVRVAAYQIDLPTLACSRIGPLVNPPSCWGNPRWKLAGWLFSTHADRAFLSKLAGFSPRSDGWTAHRPRPPGVPTSPPPGPEVEKLKSSRIFFSPFPRKKLWVARLAPPEPGGQTLSEPLPAGPRPPENVSPPPPSAGRNRLDSRSLSPGSEKKWSRSTGWQAPGTLPPRSRIKTNALCRPAPARGRPVSFDPLPTFSPNFASTAGPPASVCPPVP